MVGERDDWKSWGSKQEVRNKRKGRGYEGATAMRACKMDRKVDYIYVEVIFPSIWVR